MEHHKYFVNKDCEYYPCHPGIPEEEWSCLFCYCPWFWHCGSKGVNGELCSRCHVPHYRDRWDMMIQGITNIKASEDKKRSKPDEKH